MLHSITYKNGIKEGEAVFYDGSGNELSRGIYKNDLPYEGTFYTYKNPGGYAAPKPNDKTVLKEQTTYNEGYIVEKIIY